MQAFDRKPTARFDKALQFALFVTSGAWFFCSQALARRAAQGFSDHLHLELMRPLLGALFLLFLLAVGFSVLQSIAGERIMLSDVLGLPKRRTAGREWALGTALGWGMSVAAVLPLALAGALDVRLWLAPRMFGLLLLHLATLAAATLGAEIVFRGYPFRRLIEAIGPVKATIVLSLLFGFGRALDPYASWSSVWIGVLAGVLLSVAWLRTHGLWLPWGLHFAWSACLSALFGLPLRGSTDFSSIVQTSTYGHRWLTGGDYGPEAAVWTGLVLVVGIVVLMRVTRDYAWDYTHRPIVAAGYPTDVAPPAAHAAMEQQASASSATTPLIQILPSTPEGRSKNDEPL